MNHIIRSVFLTIFIFMVSTIASAQTPKAISFIPADPYAVKLSTPTHELKIRVIQHGLKNRDDLINEQIRYAETALSQCPGVVVKIKPVALLKVKSSTEQEKTIDFQGSTMYFNKNFMKLAQTFAANRSQGPIDVHMTEYMNTEIRKTKKLNGQINYGQGFNLSTVNTLFLDPRAPSDRKISLEDIFGNSLYLAIETVALQRNTFTKYPQATAHPRSYSLMAHELGHLILEAYNPTTHFYGDHWCPAFNAPCERGYLMSTGGNNDAYFTDNVITDKIVGYSALPLLDNMQCEILRTSKYLTKL